MEHEELVTLDSVAETAAKYMEELERVLPKNTRFRDVYRRLLEGDAVKLRREPAACFHRTLGYLEGAADAFGVPRERYVEVLLTPDSVRYEAGVLEATGTYLSRRRDSEDDDDDDFELELEELEDQLVEAAGERRHRGNAVARRRSAK